MTVSPTVSNMEDQLFLAPIPFLFPHRFYIPRQYQNYQADVSGDRRGTYGIVKKFNSLNDSPSVTIKKFIKPFESTNRAQLVLRELNLLRTLRHPNIWRLIECYTADTAGDINGIYHITEYCGESLQIIIMQGDYAMSDTMKWTRELLGALQYMHSFGDIHREIHTGCICINATNQLTLVGFGRGRVIDRETTLSTERRRKKNPYKLIEETNTQPYMPLEELVEWDRPYDAKVDIWSVGVVLCELITGLQFFGGERISASLKRQIEYCGPTSTKVLGKIKSDVERIFVKYSGKFERKDFVKILCDSMLPGRGIEPADLVEYDLSLKDFIDHTLQLDPDDRMSAEEALSHPFLLPSRPWNQQLPSDENEARQILKEQLRKTMMDSDFYSSNLHLTLPL